MPERGRGARPVVTAVEPTERGVQRRRGPGPRQRKGVARDPRSAAQGVLDRGLHATFGHGREHEHPTGRCGLRPGGDLGPLLGVGVRGVGDLLLHGEDGPGDRDAARGRPARLRRDRSPVAGRHDHERGRRASRWSTSGVQATSAASASQPPRIVHGAGTASVARAAPAVDREPCRPSPADDAHERRRRPTARATLRRRRDHDPPAGPGRTPRRRPARGAAARSGPGRSSGARACRRSR